MAVLVEELTTGAWGGALAAQVSGPLPEVPEGRHTAAVARGGSGGGGGDSSRGVEGYDLPVDLLPDPKALVLVPPSAEMLTGNARFETLVTRPDVDRVEFQLDGETVATARKAPFSARLDLGRPAAAAHRRGGGLRRAGHGAGARLGGRQRGGRRHLPGAPDRAEAAGPGGSGGRRGRGAGAAGGELDRVDVAWNDQRLSLGLLLDSSASMADDLRQTEIAAIDFLFLTLDRERDRAFLVDFDSEPRLVEPLTGDLDAIGRKLVKLQPGGYTALSDALVYALVQMQSVRGRRALVVLSDGAGREERVGYATCLRLAQQVGVPIYAIVLDRDGKERERSERVESVVRAVGGRVFYVSSLDNLGSVYRTIRDELDSQYVVAYYPPDGGGDDFRHVEVTVSRPGLSARTVSGYQP